MISVPFVAIDGKLYFYLLENVLHDGARLCLKVDGDRLAVGNVVSAALAKEAFGGGGQAGAGQHLARQIGGALPATCERDISKIPHAQSYQNVIVFFTCTSGFPREEPGSASSASFTTIFASRILHF